jgi:hypothetical protein
MIETLKAKAEELAGRELEVEQTTDGKFVVLYMRFQHSPPPKADTPEEAYQLFIERMEKQPKEVLPDVDSN